MKRTDSLPRSYRHGNIAISAMNVIIRSQSYDFSHRPLVMGILNVTPDSFSDGNRYLGVDAAVDRVRQMVEQGADIIDVGPESTRPGAIVVSAQEQIDRAIPVISGIRECGINLPLSIDTRLAEVASEALRAGADIVNDVSALRDDPAMVDVVAGAGCFVVLMHRRGDSTTMQAGGGPQYENCVAEIAAFLRERAEIAQDGGVARSNIIVDPGIGFGKRIEHNLQILSRLRDFVALGIPVLVGASRKAFIGQVLAGKGSNDPVPTEGRLLGSLAAAAVAAMAGAAILRVHDVAETVEFLRVVAAIGAPRIDAME